MKNLPAAKFLSACLACAAISSGASSEVIEIHGSSTVNNSFLRDAEKRIEQMSGIELTVVPNGSGAGLSDLAEGKADMAMISSSLESVATKLNAERPGLIETSEYNVYPLKEVEAFFITHPSNPVTKLTGEQIARLLSGEIANWSEVGGSNQSVLVVTMIPGDGVRSAVESKFLKRYEKEFSSQAREFPSSNQASNVVAQIPHAIGIASVATLHSGVKAIQTDAKVIQGLYFVTKGEPDQLEKAVIDAAQSM